MAMRYLYIEQNSVAEEYLLDLLKEASTMSDLEWSVNTVKIECGELCNVYSFSDEMYYAIRKILEERSA